MSPPFRRQVTERQQTQTEPAERKVEKIFEAAGNLGVMGGGQGGTVRRAHVRRGRDKIEEKEVILGEEGSFWGSQKEGAD